MFSASNAAFSSTTRNAGINWSAGSVALTDHDAGVAAFQGDWRSVGSSVSVDLVRELQNSSLKSGTGVPNRAVLRNGDGCRGSGSPRGMPTSRHQTNGGRATPEWARRPAG